MQSDMQPAEGDGSQDRGQAEGSLNTCLRHGFEEEYNSQQYMDSLANTFYIYYDDKRHTTCGNATPESEKRENFRNYQPIRDWKIMKDRQKTISAALVLCLNFGVDPPDIMKTHPCARTEAWIDPATFPDTKKTIEAVGKNLQAQYETLSLRTRYKQSLDPSVEDVKRFCNALRRSAKDERILFHYNGHGVPQPTQSGELWVFNRGYTQYIPISLYDLQTWLGAPCIYVFDCSSAGNIVTNFKKFVQKRIDDDNNNAHDMSAPSPTTSYLDSILLGACRSNEILPMNPELPADLFSCCLTCPIEISVKWFIMQSPLRTEGHFDCLLNEQDQIVIPGKLTDRRTPLGELNWIFTAITDSIAWTSLSRPLFKRLFRQDLMVAALFRNFLLAKRIMPVMGCNPISDPPLPDVSNHMMWDSWELAIDQILSQLVKNHHSPVIPQESDSNEFMMTYQHSTFFEQHLTAFEIWLKYGSSTKSPPEHLPIVLQVLLSQVHRLRALVLLSRFLDLGPWAVYLALSIGIFPYILKLLQSPAQELKPVLTFIWARIMSIDPENTHQELCKDKGYNYFVQILTTRQPREGSEDQPLLTFQQSSQSDVNFEEQKGMAAFILAIFTRDFRTGQRLCFSTELVAACVFHLETSESPLLRQWCALLMGQLWKNFKDAKWICYKDGYLERLIRLANDPIPEVRASVISALTFFLPAESDDDDVSTSALLAAKEELNQQEISVAIAILSLVGDGSPIVRKEIVVFYSRFVLNYLQFFLVSAFGQLEEEITMLDNPTLIDEVRRSSPAYGTIFSSSWKVLLILMEDPHAEVKWMAEQVVDHVLLSLNQSSLQDVVAEMEKYLVYKSGTEKQRPPAATRNFTHDGVFSRPNGGHLRRRGSVQPESSRRDFSSSSARSKFSSFTVENIMKMLNLTSYEQSFETAETSRSSSLRQRLNGSAGLPAEFSREPTTPRFNYRKAVSASLPLQSKFFDYSCEYFQEPQLGHNEMDEPGSEEYTRRVWRRNRNETIIAETQPQKEVSIKDGWNNEITTLDNVTQPKQLRFTQFENLLVAADDKDGITCWDWKLGKRAATFKNGNPFGTKITDLKFLNEDDVPLLLTGSSDGIVKIYRGFDSQNTQVVSAWRALTDLLLTSRSSGLVSEWQQSRGSLLVSGDVKVIRFWDAARELCLVDVPARSTASITSLTSDQVAGNVFLAGFADGSIRVYDRRLASRESMVKTWKDPNPRRSLVNTLHMQRGGYRELVSGSSAGYVNLWDIRLNDPVVSFKAYEKSMMSALVHEHAPVIATASKDVNIWTTSGHEVSSINCKQNNYLNTRASTYVSALGLHPHKMVLGTNYNQDSHIHVYRCEGVVEEY